MDKKLREQLRELFKSGYFLERRRASLRGMNFIDAPPTWMTEELRSLLDEIKEPHSRKKRTTVIRLAEAAASGCSAAEVFELSEDTCAETTWYGRFLPVRKPGWQDHPEIAAALTLAKRNAHAFYDSMEEQRIVFRRKILDNTQDRLTEISGAAVEVLFDIMVDEETASDVRRKAAVDTLTHAAPETAPKSEQKIGLDVTSVGPTMKDIKNRQRRLPGRGEDEEVPEEVLELEGVVDWEEGVPPPPRGGLRIPDEIGLYEPPPISDNGHEDEEDEEK